MLLNCGVGEDSWESLGLHQSILKEINPKYSSEGLMLKLQYFGHLMQRADALEKALMLGKTEDRRRGRQRTRWLDGITDSMDTSSSKFGDWWWTGKPGVLQSMGPQSRTWLSNWTELTHAFVCVNRDREIKACSFSTVSRSLQTES